MTKPVSGRGLLSLCFTGLLGLGGCGPAPEGPAEPEGAVAQAEQGITGYYASFDANVSSDLLWRNQASGANSVWLMNGPAQMGTAVVSPISTSLTIQATADFNPPSQLDIVIQGINPGTEHVVFLNGFTITSSNGLAARPSPDWYFAASGDFNNDTRSDLVLHNRVTGQVHYRYMNGAAVISYSPSFGRALPWYLVGAADFDLDGRTDLLWRNRTTGQNEIWRMSNTAYLGTIVLPTQPLGFYVGATGDYTLDRHPDIVWHNPSTGQVLLWRLNAGAYAGAQTIGATASGCPVWFSQAMSPPAAAGCNYLVGPR
jgi:hypothetical protein